MLAPEICSGKELDESTGTSLFPFRGLDHDQVRWLTRDPAGFIDGPNSYLYAGGDPINSVDPLGLWTDEATEEILDGDYCPSSPRDVPLNPGGIDIAVDLAEDAYDAAETTRDASIIIVVTVGLRGKGPKPGPKPLPAPANSFPKCFGAGTIVLTPSGGKPIEEVEVGEFVIGFDSTDNSTEPALVVDTMAHVVSSVLQLEFENTTLRVTEEHPFWVVEKGWVEAANLVTGDQCLLISGDRERLKSTTTIYGTFTVYNLSVDAVQTYFVTDEGILVHNKGYRKYPNPPKQRTPKPDKVPQESPPPKRRPTGEREGGGPLNRDGTAPGTPEPAKSLPEKIWDAAGDIFENACNLFR